MSSSSWYKASTLQQGIPYLRHVFVPQPVMGKSPAALRAYIDGPDAVTGRPFMQEVFDALTKPLSEEETQQMSFDRSTPRFVDADSEDNLHQLFLDNNWTDKLPIRPAHRGTGGGHAGRDQPRPGRSGRAHASDSDA